MDDIWEAALAIGVSFYNTKTIQDVRNRLRDEAEELIVLIVLISLKSLEMFCFY
jgi:hypothetical protein